MKNLRKHSAILVILSLLFSSCLTFSGIDFDSFQDNPDYRDKLIGLWVLDTSESGNYDTLEFKTDGTCSVVWYKNNKVTQTWATRYKVSNFQVVFSFEQRNDIRRANYVIIDNNTLSLTNWSNDSPNETYHKSGVVQSEIDRNDIESVLKKATDTVISNIPKETTIAIINISSGNSEVSEFIAGELENILVNNGFIVVDRSQLDKIRQEQDFQLSGDVDDSSAVSMGKFAGANIVMTGAITGSGNMRRFRLRALDTQTARVVGSASEALLDRTVSHQTATTTSSENVSYKIGDRGPAGGIVFYDSFTLKPGVLSVGVEIGYPPMEYLDSDGVTPVGFDISMARALAEKMGLEVEFIDTAWAGIFAGVDTDKYDCIISSVTINEPRLRAHNFSIPYIQNTLAIVLPVDSTLNILSPDDLEGRSVAYQEETISDDFMTELGEAGLAFTPREYDKVIYCFNDLELGRVDVIMIDLLVAYEYVAQAADKFKIVWQGGEEEFGICMKKGNNALTYAVDNALNELFEEGTMLSISYEIFDMDLVSAVRQ